MDRAKRHTLILELLSGGSIANQESLVAELAARGVKTTQATLSRDLRELGVLKGPEGYTLPGAVGGAIGNGMSIGPGGSVGGVWGGLERALRGHLLAAVPGVGMVVCKTAPGHAQVIALELDRTPPAGVIGTVGGDDTVFVAVDSSERVMSLTETLLELAGLDASLLLAGAGAEDIGAEGVSTNGGAS